MGERIVAPPGLLDETDDDDPGAVSQRRARSGQRHRDDVVTEPSGVAIHEEVERDDPSGAVLDGIACFTDPHHGNPLEPPHVPSEAGALRSDVTVARPPRRVPRFEQPEGAQPRVHRRRDARVDRRGHGGGRGDESDVCRKRRYEEEAERERATGDHPTTPVRARGWRAGGSGRPRSEKSRQSTVRMADRSARNAPP